MCRINIREQSRVNVPDILRVKRMHNVLLIANRNRMRPSNLTTNRQGIASIGVCIGGDTKRLSGIRSSRIRNG